MRISVPTFKGQNNAFAPRLINNEQAQLASNCSVKNGNLAPLKQRSGVSPQPTLAGSINTLFLYQDTHWFSWSDDVDVIESPISDDQYQRVYFTGDGVPKYTTNSLATGTGVLPFAEIELGLDSPDAFAVSATYYDQSQDLDENDDIGDYTVETESGYINIETDDDETRFYVCTYVTEFGEESAPSVVTSEVNLFHENDNVTLTFSDTGGFGSQRIDRRRIYRSATSGDVTEFFLVDELPVGTSTYTDSKSTYELGATLTTESFVKPPDDLKGLIATSNGVVIGYVGNTIVPSEPYLPYAFPLEYRQTLQDEVVAMAEMSAGVVIATTDKPAIMQGVLPDSFTMTVIDAALPCVSKRSMVDMGEAAIFASHDGLVSVSQSGAQLVTQNLLSTEYWQSLNPSTIQAYRYNNYYVGFYGGVGGFVFDLQRGDFFTLDFYASAGYFHSASGKLYLVVDGELTVFDEGAALSYSWTSKEFDVRNATLSCLKVFTENAQDTAMRVYADNSLVADMTLTGPDPVARLPAFRARRLFFVLQGKAEIETVTIATSPGELNG